MDNNCNIPRFSPTLCLTHNCNLDCIYCYQEHDTGVRMSLDTAKKVIDWIFLNIPSDTKGIEFGFIGGEPLLEFELIKDIVDYVRAKDTEEQYIFYATTNGTVLTEEMKKWFEENRHQFVLGLSLDGLKETHDYNRSNSFDKIDFDFFLRNWPEQGIKMTLSEKSLEHLADNIIFAHSLGFKEIGGVNLFEGQFDWSDEKYIKILIPQLEALVEYYVEDDDIPLDQMMNKTLYMCENKSKEYKKWCGIGDGAVFFDCDGTKYPCPFVTPMTFSEEELADIMAYDFSNPRNAIDEDCFNNCYIYPICPTCSGANYLKNKSFKKRDRSKCRIQKLIALYSADLQAKRLLKNPESTDKERLYYTITAIKHIKELFYDEFKEYMN